MWSRGIKLHTLRIWDQHHFHYAIPISLKIKTGSHGITLKSSLFTEIMGAARDVSMFYLVSLVLNSTPS
jgi:hypothetical protein